MIKFFRKIRQKLLDEGNFKRYLTYALGEILLVVIGILIALQINNLNQDRLNKKEEALLLDAISQKINFNGFQHQMGLEQYSEVINGAKNLIKFSGKPIQDSTRSHIEQSIFDLKRRFLLGKSNQISIYDELIASGKLNLLSSKKLRLELTALKSNFQLLASYEDVQNNFVDNQLSPYLNNKVDFISITNNAVKTNTVTKIQNLEYTPRNEIVNDYSILLEDQTFLNLLAELIAHTNILFPIYERIGINIQNIDDIVKM